MKIDLNKIKKGTSEVPPECQAIIQKLKICYQDKNNENLLQELQQTKSWTYGKCELFHWVDVLNIFDDILEHGAQVVTSGLWSLAADTYNKKSRDLLLEVLRFTTLLIEHSFSRHLYNSMEHLLVLMGSSNLEILNGVLNLLYMFSKRSNFIPRLNLESKSALLKYLMYLAESWGGCENGFSLASCCQEVLKPELKESATTLHFEYYDDTPNQKNKVTTIHVDSIDQINKSLAGVMDELIEAYTIPQSQRMVLFTQLRLAHGFSDYKRRLLCVQARLQAITVLVYSNGLNESTHQVVLYNGLLEELVELLELTSPELVDIRAAALRTLTSVIHLDRNPHFPKKPGSRLSTIIDVTGASNYHGQLPVMVRTCIASLTGSEPHEQARVYGASVQPFPLPLATALFSFLYHLASYESGGEALVSCGMMESLLKVINWPGEDLDQITFVTRAVRVIDLITNIDMTAFQSHQGLTSFIHRLELEVDICRKEQPFEITIPGVTENSPDTDENIETADTNQQSSTSDQPQAETSTVQWISGEENHSSLNQLESSDTPATPATSHYDGDVVMEDDSSSSKVTNVPIKAEETAMDVVEVGQNKTDESAGKATAATNTQTEMFRRSTKIKESVDYSGNRWADAKTGKVCLPQRAALIKSILNFLKKAIQDQAFSESMKTVMEGSLPNSLKHVISNADYYGPSLFLLATDVVTVYIFQEPSLLSTLQDNNLTDVVLQALLVKEVPATREVLASLPNVISALCLNARGLNHFKQFHSFDHLCEIFVHPLYLPAMRRRRSNDPLGDTATTLGNAMDELMRHHPDLKTEAMKAVINLLDEIYVYGTSPQYVCESYTNKKTSSMPDPPPASNNDGGGSSDEEEEEDKEAPATAAYYVRAENNQGKPHISIPLIDYIHNVMKFIDAILSNNSTEDHCKEFVTLGGLKYVVKLLSMPNLPADYAVTPAAQSVANVCKSILSLAREPKVLEEGLKELLVVLKNLEPLSDHTSEKCVLLHELAMVPDLENSLYSYSATPLLHSMAATHGFVIMFVHVCRTSQSEMRNTSISTWGSPHGLDVLHKLSSLYTALVWESTLLLALCSDDIIPADCDFGQEDLNMLIPQKEGRLLRSTTEAMNTMKVESPSPVDVFPEGSCTSSTKSQTTRVAPTPDQLKHLKLLLGAASRLGRALAELFGLLVKLCVGSPKRRVTFQHHTVSYPTKGATDVAEAMAHLLARGLNWKLVPKAPLEKFMLTYLICSVGFTSPMLFDDKKQPYHMIMYYFVTGDANKEEPCGLTAFFNSMEHVLGLGKKEMDADGKFPAFPEGIGEFLDAWLMLLEKMTNPKLILESPNVFVQENKLDNAAVLEFCPYKYLTRIHSLAFNAVMEMWGRTPLKGYGFRITDSMLCILRHILVGEKMIQERFTEARRNRASLTVYGDRVLGGSGGGQFPPSSPVLHRPAFLVGRNENTASRAFLPNNEQDINQLCDMGFTRGAAIEALERNANLEMAINYLIETSDYQDVFEDLTLLDNLEQNINETLALTREVRSLGSVESEQRTSQDLTSSQSTATENPPSQDSYACRRTEDICAKIRAMTKPGPKSKKKWRCQMNQDERYFDLINYIKKHQLPPKTVTTFTQNALTRCLKVLESLPETVYRVCDLLMVICDRNGFQWCENMLDILCNNIADEIVQLIRTDVKSLTVAGLQEIFVASDEAKKISVQLHLLTLLFDDLRFVCVRAMNKCSLIDHLISLLKLFSGSAVSLCKKNIETSLTTPQWIAPLLLLSELFEKTSVYTHRMNELHKACTGIWKWYQLKTGKWTLYSTQNNKIINEAYWSGAPGCRVTIGESRRKYQLNFNTLSQVNEDTTRGLPITMSLRRNVGQDFVLSPDQVGCCMEKEENDIIYNKAHVRTQAPIKGLSKDHRILIILASVELMQIPADSGALHACMRLTLRLTRDFHYAKLFAEKGGVKALLDLEQESNFTGFISLATLIFRHVMEEPATLRTAIERTIRGRISTENQPFFRELLFLMRHLEAGICRDPELFLEVAKKVLRIQSSEEERLILKYVRNPTSSTEETCIDKAAVDLIHILLRQLVAVDETSVKGKTDTSTKSAETSKQQETSHTQTKSNLTQTFSFNNFVYCPIRKQVIDTSESDSEKKTDKDEKNTKKLLSKSVILNILTDAVKSYTGYAKLITDFIFEADPSNPLLTEDTTAIRFILEKFVFLPTSIDKESMLLSSEARILLGAIGACNHSTAVQTQLVMEVKNCIQRIVSSPYEDAKRKYSDVSSILRLISDMMTMCPPVNWMSFVNSASMKNKNNVAYLSNISKLFTRKGLINELARLPHYLDLSNPNFVPLMNAALKPLETLTRLANDRHNKGHGVDTLNTNKNNTSQRTDGAADPTPTNSSGTTSGNTNAQGEEVNEDAENTENDLSAAAESLEPASDNAVNDDITELSEIGIEDANIASDRSSSMRIHDIGSSQDRENVENDELSNPELTSLQTALMQMTSEMVHGLITELQPNNQEQLTDPDDPDNLEEDQYGDEQMEEDQNDNDESGYNNDNDDPDEDFLIRASIFNRSDHLMNDLLFVQYPNSEINDSLGSLGSFPELFHEDPSFRQEDPAVQNPPPIHHPLLVRRSREELAPSRNNRNRPRRYQLFPLNTRGLTPRQPPLLETLLFSRRHVRTMDIRTASDHDDGPSNPNLRISNFLLMQNGLGMLPRPDEENIDLLDQSVGYYFGQHLTTSMQSVCYVRWASEMKILDADSAAMVATVLCHRLKPTLENYYAEEMMKKKLAVTDSSTAMDVSSPPSTNTEANKGLEAVDANSKLSSQDSDSTNLSIAPTSNVSTLPAVIMPSDGSRSQAEDSDEVPCDMFQLDEPPVRTSHITSVEISCDICPMDQPPSRPDVPNDIFCLDEPPFDSDRTFRYWNSPRSEYRNMLLQHGIPLPSDLDYDLARSDPSNLPREDEPLNTSSDMANVLNSSANSNDATSVQTSSGDSSADPLSEETSESTSSTQQESSNNTNEDATITEENQTDENDGDSTITPDVSLNRTTLVLSDSWPSLFDRASPQPIQNTESSQTSGQDTSNPVATIENALANETAGSQENPGSEPEPGEITTQDEESCPVPLDPEEMIQLYPNGRATYRGIQIPQGLDPSFLAALPFDMREEVFTNHLRQQSIQRATDLAQVSNPTTPAVPDEVNPEFLAALPPNIQEEVLAQQRQERQRLEAAQANPNDPFDAASFFQNLPPSLRQSILADIEESQISVLPPDLAAEAQSLRREHDARNRQFFQERERILSASSFATLLRTQGRGQRLAIHTVPSSRSNWGISPIDRNNDSGLFEPSSETVGRQLLDQEAVTTLLVLLFVQDFHLNINRLHRVIRNLCYHPPTRDFVIRTLISIMEKCNDSRSSPSFVTRQPSPKRRITRSAYLQNANLESDIVSVTNKAPEPEPTWLNLSMDAALGCRANVFQVQLKKFGKRGLDNYLAANVSIHPQAAPIVFSNAMDLLYALAKFFQCEFLPKKAKENDKEEGTVSKNVNTSFWDILVRLENLNSGKQSKKGKSTLKNQNSTPFFEVEPRPSTFEKSLMGHLIKMLTSPLVRGSTPLKDKLLHILNFISEALILWNKDDAVPVNEEHLKILVNVLTSSGCTETGLEQVTNVIIRMIDCPTPTADTILKLLIIGAQDVASLVKSHVEALLLELREANAKAKQDVDEFENRETKKRKIQDRFTKKNVIITAPSKVKGGFDIQLPAMQPLISKTSSQSYFLRILKVIIQARNKIVSNKESEWYKDQRKKRENTTASVPEKPTIIGENTEAAQSGSTETELLFRSSEGDDAMNIDIEPNTLQSEEELICNTRPSSEIDSNSAVIENALRTTFSKPDFEDLEMLMDTDSDKRLTPAQLLKMFPLIKTQKPELLPPLTKLLNLDPLWISLSECLTELEKTPDHHAALILQPAVEAFFLVHSTAIDDYKNLVEQSKTTSTTPPEVPNPTRRRNEQASRPIFQMHPQAAQLNLDFGVNDILERTQAQQNLLASQSNTNGSPRLHFFFRNRQLRPLRMIIAEYRHFINGEPSPPAQVEDEPVADSSSESIIVTSDLIPSSSLPCDDEASLADFFKSIENLPLGDPFKFLRFAELHRSVLNQILRQSTTPIAEGPFAILFNYSRVMDFDVKRKFFRQEIELNDEVARRSDEVAININRNHVFEESFRELHRKSPEEWMNKFYVVFENEEGQDAGGLLREWYMIISREIFNPDYALFTVSPGDRVTYTINPSSHCNHNHLLYFKFVGRLIAKAIHDSKYLECYFTRSFYKHILGIPIKYQDMESEDPEFYEGLVFLKKHKVADLGNDLTFTTDVQEFGVTETRELKPGGANIPVTEENKMEYVNLVCQMKMTGAIRKQLDAFLEGFYDIIPKHLISIFNEQELELLISGLPVIDIEDLKNNTEYNKYSKNSIQIMWFWKALREMDSQDQAKFLQFVTGTSKVPLQGFAALEGMNGIQKFQIHRDDRSTDRLPSAHTCFNQLDLPAYETFNKLKTNLLKAIHECSEGFGFA